MVTTVTDVATFSRDDEEPSSSLLHLSNSTDASVDILADLDDPDSDERLSLLFQSTGSGSSQAADERMLIDSMKTSVISAMDEEVHKMSSSMHDLSFDPVDEFDEVAFSRRNSLYLENFDRSMIVESIKASQESKTRGRSPVATRPRKRISVKDVDFDPIPSLETQQHRHSIDDLASLCSFNTAQTSDPLHNSSTSLSLLNPEEQQVSYHSALSSLAQSMKRTEESRRQVMMQRSLLTPAQRASLEEARNRQLQAIQTEALIPVQTPTSTRELSPTRSGIVDAFFAGSRSTLTNGLEQSRRQLRNYMSQVQNQTL
jgi:hypothetical protein